MLGFTFSDPSPSTHAHTVGPVISKCDSVVHFKDGQKVTISWKIRPSPYHHFIIHVYKEGTDDPVHSKEINFDSTKHCYEESFNVPGHTRGTYSVVVEAVRESGQSVYSERTPLETSKSVWHFCFDFASMVFCIV